LDPCGLPFCGTDSTYVITNEYYMSRNLKKIDH